MASIQEKKPFKGNKRAVFLQQWKLGLKVFKCAGEKKKHDKN